MSDQDAVNDIVDRLEWADGKEEETPSSKMRALTRRTALTGGAAGLATLALQACGGSSSPSKSTAATAPPTGGANVFGSGKKYKFVFVNHVTTNPFFVPTKYGAADACKLLGCSYQWTGSETSNVNQMVNAMNTAITGGADGIAVALIDAKAFNTSTEKALQANIPVLAYNADAVGNARLGYIGQDLYVSGQKMGEQIKSLVPSGDVALFIATPGAANIQPRIDGAKATLKGTGITAHSVTTGAAVPDELSAIDAYWVGHKDTTKGMFAVDGGSTQSVAQVMQKYKLPPDIKAGGYDLTPVTQTLLAAKQINFTIDQQPYLQGFLPILQMYMYLVSGTLTGIADVNTGVKFLSPTDVVPYNNTKSRYEGTSATPGLTKA
jgi:simple sugar transport system substrate-binding protein